MEWIPRKDVDAPRVAGDGGDGSLGRTRIALQRVSRDRVHSTRVPHAWSGLRPVARAAASRHGAHPRRDGGPSSSRTGEVLERQFRRAAICLARARFGATAIDPVTLTRARVCLYAPQSTSNCCVMLNVLVLGQPPTTVGSR